MKRWTFCSTWETLSSLETTNTALPRHRRSRWTGGEITWLMVLQPVYRNWPAFVTAHAGILPPLSRERRYSATISDTTFIDTNTYSIDTWFLTNVNSSCCSECIENDCQLIFCAHPAALSKNRVWTRSLPLVKLGSNHTGVTTCCRTNQIAQVK